MKKKNLNKYKKFKMWFVGMKIQWFVLALVLQWFEMEEYSIAEKSRNDFGDLDIIESKILKLCLRKDFDS